MLTELLLDRLALASQETHEGGAMRVSLVEEEGMQARAVGAVEYIQCQKSSGLTRAG